MIENNASEHGYPERLSCTLWLPIYQSNLHVCRKSWWWWLISSRNEAWCSLLYYMLSLYSFILPTLSICSTLSICHIFQVVIISHPGIFLPLCLLTFLFPQFPPKFFHSPFTSKQALPFQILTPSVMKCIFMIILLIMCQFYTASKTHVGLKLYRLWPLIFSLDPNKCQ